VDNRGRFRGYAWMSLEPTNILLSFIIFHLSLKVLAPFFSLLHELGHAIPALMFTKGEVMVGLTLEGGKEFRVGRLIFSCRLRGTYHGSCEFPTEGVANRILALIVAGGPLFSSLLAVFSICGMLQTAWPPLPRLLLAAAGYANLRIFLTSAIPFVHKVPGSTEEVPSDGKRFLEYLQKCCFSKD
jgi:hypothetical protein